MVTPPERSSQYDSRTLRSCKGPRVLSRPQPALPELPRGARSFCLGYAYLMGARRLSRHGKVGSVRPPAGVTQVGHPLPHTRPPSPPSTKPGRIAHAAQSIGQVKCVHELTRPIRQMARHYPLRRAGWGWQYSLGAPCCTFPDPRGNYGIRPSFTQIPVSLDGRARANFEADELLAPVRRRSGQILSDRMLLLSGRKLPYTL